MTKRTLIVANWKMNLNVSQASLLVHRLQERIKILRDIEVVLAPTSLVLQPLSLQIDRRKFRLAAQNAHFKDEGAFTGEVSFTMLRDIVHYSLVGHSERRLYFNESYEDVRNKVAAAVRNEISPILCVGETKHERVNGETKQVLHDQVTTALSNLTAREMNNVVIAYEPVWAIAGFGGEAAKPDEAKRAMDYIRYQVGEMFNKKVAERIRMIYGGSVNDETAGAFLAIEGCDGVLPGSASLNYEKFAGIVDSAYRLRYNNEGE